MRVGDSALLETVYVQSASNWGYECGCVCVLGVEGGGWWMRSLGLGGVGRVVCEGDAAGRAHLLQVADAVELQATLHIPTTLLELSCFLLLLHHYYLQSLSQVIN